jgi:tRNA(fMet)-specific endonuclease VapC
MYLIKKRPPEVLEQFRQHPPQDVAISTITFFELEYEVQKSQYIERTQDALERFLLPLTILDMDQPAAIDAAAIRASLEKKARLSAPMTSLSLGWPDHET